MSQGMSLFKRMRLVLDMDLSLPNSHATDTDRRALDQLMRQPQGVVDAVLLYQALSALKEFETDDLARLAGCDEAGPNLDGMLAKIMSVGGYDAESSETMAEELSEHLRTSLAVSMRQLVNLEPSLVVQPGASQPSAANAH